MLALGLLAGTLACDPSPATTGASLTAACELPQVAPVSRVRAVESAVATVSDSSATPIAGMHIAGDSVFLLDRIAGKVLRVVSTGAVDATLGRHGRGPGEFTPLTDHAVLSFTAGTRDWLTARGDTLIALDGNAFHSYSFGGAHLGSRAVPEEVRATESLYPRETSRVRVRGSELVIDVTTLMHIPRDRLRPPVRSHDLWVINDSSARLWTRRALLPPPVNEKGGLVLSVLEARPLYDLAGKCAVVSDGGSPYLLLLSPNGDRVDTIRIRTTLRDPVPNEDERIARRLSGAGDEPLPPPALPRRIRALVVDPDGWIWLLPVQADRQPRIVEVIRVHIGSGAEYVDTVPVFPEVFSGPRRYRALEMDSLGVSRIHTVDLLP